MRWMSELTPVGDATTVRASFRTINSIALALERLGAEGGRAQAAEARVPVRQP